MFSTLIGTSDGEGGHRGVSREFVRRVLRDDRISHTDRDGHVRRGERKMERIMHTSDDSLPSPSARSDFTRRSVPTR